MGVRYCRVQDCEREAERVDLCALHRKRFQRQAAELTTGVLRRTDPWDRVFEAAKELFMVLDSDDEGYERARERLRKAAKSYGAWLLVRDNPRPRETRD